MNSKQQVSHILKAYKNIYQASKKPDWAVENRRNGEIIKPSIPFIGNNYGSLKNKILLYASAENLTYYEKSNSPNKLLETEDAWNRRRNRIKLKRDCIFPNIHIAPVSNGGLLATVALVAYINKLIETPTDPYKFIENLSIDNLGKYSIKTLGSNTRKNKDYISNLSYLKYSIPFIEEELSILKPNYIIIPKKAYELKPIKDIFQKIVPEAKIVPIYQLTSTVVNCHLASKISEKEITKFKRRVPKNIKNWVSDIHINGLRKDGMYYYFLHVLNVIEKI